jgi:hypothetical protein
MNNADTQKNQETTELEGNFDLVEFADVPEPMVAAHIPMQED